MKKIFVGAFVLLFASIGILSGCSCSRDENTTGFVASNDLISYGAYSTVSLLSSFSGDMLSNQNMLFDSGNLGPILLTETTTDTEVESQIDMFHR